MISTIQTQIKMIKRLLYIFILLISVSAFSQANKNAFKQGEWLKFDLSYSGFLKAGEATLSVNETTNQGKAAYHVIGKGKTTGMIKWFFAVKDNYQTYFYKENLKPYKFIRKIDEGGYKKNKEIHFDHESKTALVIDHKNNTKKSYKIKDIQDMLSSLYYLRGQDFSNYKNGDAVKMKLFFDGEMFDFKLKLLGRETIKTKFGKVKTLRFRPYVQAGRVFKEQESLTVWVSDDENKIPLKIKASLAVGSLNAKLVGYKGLANPFNIIY